MTDWKGKVAVVTGAAGEVGRGLAHRFAREGMVVVIADIDAANLEQTEDQLRQYSGTVLTVPTDIFKPEQLDRLAAETHKSFGNVDVLCANAGVMGPYTYLWEQRPEDLQWVFGVNVFGTVNTIRAFLPSMIQNPAESHVVITASEAGWSTSPLIGTYHASKHAVVAYAETLAKEVQMVKAAVRVHMLCPLGVRAPRLHDPDRQRFRPEELRTENAARRPEGERIEEARLANSLNPNGTGNSGAEVAEAVFDGINSDRFYIFPDPRVREVIQRAFEVATSEQYPTPNPNIVAQATGNA